MISIKQATTLLEIESLYRHLGTLNGSQLRLPNSLKYGGGFGVPASLIQFIASWSRQHPAPTLKLYSSADEQALFRAMASEPHGMTALYFAPNIVSGSNAQISLREGLEHAVPYIQAMQSNRYRETMHGRGVFLSCFAGAKNEYLLPLYSKGKAGTLRGREDFITLTSQIISACAPSAMRSFTPTRLKSVANLLYELFRNTDEHAQTSENGSLYRRNVRGLLAKFVSINEQSATMQSSGEDVSQNLFMLRSLANKRLFPDQTGRARSGNENYFLELTVFDTGPGLVRRWLSKHAPETSIDALSISDEVDYVRKCFERHATTKDNEGSGHGLDLVVSVLFELNAFLRLRTGRICLVQDFSTLKTKKFEPRHWQKDQHSFALTAGATYSIIVPLSRGNE